MRSMEGIKCSVAEPGPPSQNRYVRLMWGRVNKFNCYTRCLELVHSQKLVDLQIASVTGPESVTVKRFHEVRIARAAAIRLPRH